MKKASSKSKIFAKKKQKCKKKADIAYSICEFMQKRAKMHFQFRNSYKKKQKKNSDFFLDFFAFISPVHIFAF